MQISKTIDLKHKNFTLCACPTSKKYFGRGIFSFLKERTQKALCGGVEGWAT